MADDGEGVAPRRSAIASTRVKNPSIVSIPLSSSDDDDDVESERRGDGRRRGVAAAIAVANVDAPRGDDAPTDFKERYRKLRGGGSRSVEEGGGGRTTTDGGNDDGGTTTGWLSWLWGSRRD